MSYHINKVHAPEFLPIPGGLKVGTQILIRGKTPYGADRFSIDLVESPSDGSRSALHFNPRIDERIVVRNSYDGGWADEERDVPFFPFLEGTKFTLRLVVTPDEFDINMNGKDFIHFSHRMSFNDMYYLALNEHAEYYDVDIQNEKSSPFDGVFPGNGLKEGVAVRIKGLVNHGADYFSINFDCDRDADNVGFQFNPRPGTDIVIRNSKRDGDWGDEETDTPEFPFQPGEFFDLLIIATEGRFNIYVNEKFYVLYDYRVPVDDIKYLRIDGDVTIADTDVFEPLPGDFKKEIRSGLEKSDMIIVKGFFYPEGDQFSINLLTGDSYDDGDVAFHFNPRRGEGEVIMNSRFDGDWDSEERHSNPSAFNEMLPFEVKIVVKSNKFKTYVNGKKFEKFKGRCSLDAIKNINVHGEAYIFEVKLLQRLDKPVCQKIPGGVRPGKWIFVHGTAKKEANKFEINLQCNDTLNYDETDIALHFNPRFSEEVTVRNHLIDGSWGGEEQDQPFFPFSSEDTFNVAINVQSDKFKVYANGRHYIDFDHRIDIDKICHIMLDGDANFFEPEFN